MINALCFDFDGTLVHYTGDFTQLLQATFKTLELSQYDFQKAADGFTRHLRQEGHSTLPSILRGILRDLDQSEKDVSSAVEEAMERYLNGVALLPGTEEVLKQTCHLPRALITNGPSDMQRAAVRQVGLEDTFQTIIVSGDEEVAVRKPNKRIFEIACERLRVKPENTLMIGDNLEADVRGALAYGMQAVWLGERNVEDIESVRDTVALYDYLDSRLTR